MLALLGPALLSGVLYVLAFPPYGVAPLAFVALVPWLVQILRTPHRRGRLLGSWVFCITISLLGFHWVAYVLKQFAGLPWILAGVGLLGFSTFGQLQVVGFALTTPRLAKLLRSSPHPALTLLWLALGALTYTACDFLLPKLFRDTLGHSWANFVDLRLNARWAGAYGLTFVTSFCNLALAWAIVLWRDRDEPSAWPALRRGFPGLLASAILLLILFGYGASTREWIEKEYAQAKRKIPIAVIQANIGDIEKISAESGLRDARKKVLKTFFELSDQALARAPKTQAIIWPETSYPATFRTPDLADDLELDQQVENYSKSRKVGLFFGGYDQNRNLRKDYNAFFFLSPEAKDLQIYRKNRLLLFGEEMPFAQTFPQLRRWFPQVGNFGRGDGPTSMVLPTDPPTRAAPAICYEVLFSNDMIAAKKSGAEWILNITNDSWFGPYAEPELHLALSTFRSIELGIPMVRSTNTGITAWVDPTGKIREPTRTFEPAVLPIELPIVPLPPSWVERLGDLFGALSLALATIGHAWGHVWSTRRLSKL